MSVVIKKMHEELARFEASGEAPKHVFVQSPEAYRKEHDFAAAQFAKDPELEIRPASRVGMNEDGDQTQWRQLYNAKTDELMYTANVVYSCPPWPIEYCEE